MGWINSALTGRVIPQCGSYKKKGNNVCLAAGHVRNGGQGVKINKEQKTQGIWLGHEEKGGGTE